jgi:hypothetical protein
MEAILSYCNPDLEKYKCSCLFQLVVPATIVSLQLIELLLPHTLWVL